MARKKGDRKKTGEDRHFILLLGRRASLIGGPPFFPNEHLRP